METRWRDKLNWIINCFSLVISDVALSGHKCNLVHSLKTTEAFQDGAVN
jgi:hypothetical protein